MTFCHRPACSILVGVALLGTKLPSRVHSASEPKELPVNRWVKLPTSDAGSGYSWSSPVYVPTRGQLLHWGAVARGAGRNDIRAFDAARGDWSSDYPSAANDVGIGGGSGTALSYTGKGEMPKHGSCDRATLVWKERTDGRFGKFSSSSSGCESRPIKAEPSRSVASLAVGVATARLMRRQTKRRAVGHAAPKTRCSRMPKGSPSRKAAVVVTDSGRGDGASGGVDDHGAAPRGRPSNLGGP
jgi:hypothetical protein